MAAPEQIRDELALERTRLANERTLLAYLRTSLAMFAGAAVLLQFFETPPPLLALAWALIVGGLIALSVGGYRYLRVRSRLNERARS